MKIDERKYLPNLPHDVFNKEARVYVFDSRFHDRMTKGNYLDYLDDKIRQLS